MRPRQRFPQNQHTRELITAQKTSPKHNNKDPSPLRYLSPGMHVNTRYVNSTRGTSSKRRTFGGVMYLVFESATGGIYVPCIYVHARWPLLQVTPLLCLCGIFQVLRELPMCVDIPRNISFLHAWLASPPGVRLLNSDHFTILLCRTISKQSTTKHDPMKNQHQ